MKVGKALLIAITITALAGCGGPEPQAYDKDGNPIARQSNNDGLMGFIAGTFLGNMIGRQSNSGPSNTVVEKHYYQKPAASGQPQTQQKQAPASAPPRQFTGSPSSGRSISVPSPSRSFSGGSSGGGRSFGGGGRR